MNGMTARRWRLVGPAGRPPVPSGSSCPAVRRSAVSDPASSCCFRSIVVL